MTDDPVDGGTGDGADAPETLQRSWNLRTVVATVIIAGVIVGATFCAAGDEAFQLRDSAPSPCVTETQPDTC